MDKLAKKHSFLIVSMVVVSVMTSLVSMLNFIFLVKILVCAILFVLDCVLAVFIYKISKQMILEKQKELEEKKKKQANVALMDIYAILGIPPQYTPDGKLKDVYELLGIQPVYDELGKRQLTIYELLAINPIFRNDGTEIPFVLRIKNRVNALVKTSKQTIPLIFIPREKQIIGGVKVPTKEVPEQQEIKKTPVIIVKKNDNKAKAPAKKAKTETPNYGKSSSRKSEAVHKGNDYNNVKTIFDKIKPVEKVSNTSSKQASNSAGVNKVQPIKKVEVVKLDPAQTMALPRTETRKDLISLLSTVEKTAKVLSDKTKDMTDGVSIKNPKVKNNTNIVEYDFGNSQ